MIKVMHFWGGVHFVCVCRAVVEKTMGEGPRERERGGEGGTGGR